MIKVLSGEELIMNFRVEQLVIIEINSAKMSRFDIFLYIFMNLFMNFAFYSEMITKAEVLQNTSFFS